MAQLTVSKAKKLVKKMNSQIAKDNLAFSKMSKDKKRVQIARDVLAQLRGKKFVATTGVWLKGRLSKSKKIETVLDKEVQDVLKEVKSCTGCAVGGMFMCAVQRADKLKVGQLEVHENNPIVDYDQDDRDIHLNEGNQLDVQMTDAFDYLGRYFDKKQLNLIENAFEQGDGACGHAGASSYAAEISDPSERMRLIMENIVVNKGTFDPDQEPEQVWTTKGFRG